MMDQPPKRTVFTLRDAGAPLKWTILLLVSIALIVPLELVHLPAALLLGAMGAAILVAVFDGKLAVPHWPYVIAQGLIGCLVARSIGPAILVTMVRQWPLFLAGVSSVLLISTSLGALLARWKVLPGTTAIWGSSPGAATVMVLMSEGFGGDPRLVAYMQFLRVILVALVASIVARLWVAPGALPRAAIDWFPAVVAGPFWETVALAVFGSIAGAKSRLPAGALLVPLFAGVALSCTGVMTITLPPWLMAACYALIGWSIGLRFSREIVMYAGRVFPKIAASTLTLIALCGGLAVLLHLLVGTDPLTAYLATSPGGADSVAIIAASSHVDVPFVMAMQVARFILVLVVGPALARAVVRWTKD
ncbi:MAG TPA: AbrB family transcriptional regulator [Steroidobacteraceae bacterium]|jgi:membrane AbrB-like protein|nr:AbrB family transcriptional regulator [Steroidobacteraceae bacterium]